MNENENLNQPTGMDGNPDNYQNPNDFQNQNDYQSQNGYQNQNGYQYQYDNRNVYQSVDVVPPDDGPKVSNAFGIASLVLGILALVLFCTCINVIMGVLAIIFGIVQLVRGANRAMPIVGIVTGAVGIIAFFVYWIAIMGSASWDEIYNDPYSILEEYESDYDIDLDSYQEDRGFVFQ
ncbi:MAG: DUF4190 domain-containing protein [Lachnospiraceae bacterium]|nr:DUF4190 domain-containing protein [Lachnospiraceae bacterium]